MTDEQRKALTERQRDVARLIAEGRTNKQIAAMLGITSRRVLVLITAAVYRLELPQGGDDRVQLALWWVRYSDSDSTAQDAAA